MERTMKYVFCDESRQDLLVSHKSITSTNRYACIGGIMLPKDKVPIIKAEVNELREKNNVHGEMKWGTVSSDKLEFYRSIVDLFFKEDYLSFKTIVIDADKVDNETFNQSDQELGYYKFYYELLSHWLNYYEQYRIFTDQKTNCDASRLKELRRILNNSNHHCSYIGSIQAIDSKESVLLQIENILMGAVGYKYNFQSEGNSHSKNLIVKQIEQHIGHQIASTDRKEAKFNIFQISLKEGKTWDYHSF